MRCLPSVPQAFFSDVKGSDGYAALKSRAWRERHARGKTQFAIAFDSAVRVNAPASTSG